ncbi:MAG: anti-sigma factor domain-containing protein [Solirubrobacteraceae bacterium]
MNGAERPGGCDQRAGDAAAYALGALEPDEAAAFEHHLESCPACREELLALQQVVRALPYSMPQYEAPRALRRKVLGDYRSGQRVERARGGRSSDPPRRRGWWAASGRLSPRALTAGALAALVIATAAVIVALPGSSPATRTVAAHVVGSQGTAELRLSGGHAELVVAHLPAPATGHIYEMWLLRGHHTAPSTLFGVDPQGSAAVEVAGDLHSVNDVLVTQEPAGGTAVPTTPPVIVAPLQS